MNAAKRLFGSLTFRLFILLVSGIALASSLSLFFAIYSIQTVKNERFETVLGNLISQLQSAAPTERDQVAGQFRLQRVDAQTGSASAQAVNSAPLSIGFVAGVTPQIMASPSGARLPDQPIQPQILRVEPAAGLPLPALDCETLDQGRNAVTPQVCSGFAVTLSDGSVEQFMLPLPDRPSGMLFSIVGGVLFVVLLGSLAAVSAIVAAGPVRRLARAAGQLGSNIAAPPLAEVGPSEVVEAAHAFNLMQDRIQKHIAERTQILAAITHDLRTPLTRLRLRLENLKDADLRDRLAADVLAMDQLINEGLLLASTENSDGTLSVASFDSLVRALCEDAMEVGQPVSLSGQTTASISCDIGLVGRAINNMLDNAIKYGSSAHVELEETEHEVSVTIRDQGPGMSADTLENAFSPFWREDSSRSRETGGAGLGLTIARRAIEKHGGRIELANRPNGNGLACRITLPILKSLTTGNGGPSPTQQ